MMDDHDGFDDALALGTGYALYRHGQDALAARIERAIERAVAGFDFGAVVPTAPSSPRRVHEYVEPTRLSYSDPSEWDLVIGQQRVLAQLRAMVASAGVRRGRIPHLLLSANASGMGRRTLVRVAAREAGVRLVELCAPFDVDTLASVVDGLSSYDILFIDDVERACEAGQPGATTIGRLIDHLDLVTTGGDERIVPEIAIVGSTVVPDQLPGAIADRFTTRLHLDPYDFGDRARLAINRIHRRLAEEIIGDDLAVDIAVHAATPRAVDELVVLARDFSLAQGREVDIDDILALRSDGSLAAPDLHATTRLQVDPRVPDGNGRAGL